MVRESVAQHGHRANLLLRNLVHMTDRPDEIARLGVVIAVGMAVRFRRGAGRDDKVRVRAGQLNGNLEISDRVNQMLPEKAGLVTEPTLSIDVRRQKWIPIHQVGLLAGITEGDGSAVKGGIGRRQV